MPRHFFIAKKFEKTVKKYHKVLDNAHIVCYHSLDKMRATPEGAKIMEVNKMKLSEMNTRQKIATKLAWEMCGDIVGGFENTLLDYDPSEEEYKNAERLLKDHDALVEMIYDDVMSDTEKIYLKHLRFVGKDFIIERIDRRLKKWGY